MPKIDEEEGGVAPPSPPPWADEASPGLGRRSGVMEDERRQSGGLSDESPEDPVRDSNPFRPAGAPSKGQTVPAGDPPIKYNRGRR